MKTVGQNFCAKEETDQSLVNKKSLSSLLRTIKSRRIEIAIYNENEIPSLLDILVTRFPLKNILHLIQSLQNILLLWRTFSQPFAMKTTKTN